MVTFVQLTFVQVPSAFAGGATAQNGGADVKVSSLTV